MPIEMPRGLPFSVDTWSRSSRAKRYHFLTHAHKDHASSISNYASFPIYATRITKHLIIRQFPQVCDSLFVEMRVGEPIVVDDPDCRFTFTAFDANHCPGAVMLLFEGEFGNILHTGDCRLTADCIQCLPMKYVSMRGRKPLICLDYLFLDCTFAGHAMKIPSKDLAVQQVIKCIWEHPNAPIVYLACDLLGQEEILVHVSKTFGSKIYIDRSVNAEYYEALTIIASDVITDDSSSRFQVCEGFPRFYEKAETKLAAARANLQPEPLFIRPSTQWYACREDYADDSRKSNKRWREAERDEFGVWHVCYSIHSSKEELELALQYLQPKRVISTTPSCRAVELDYVKKNCGIGSVSSDDALWKLLDIRTEELHSTQACLTKVNPAKANELLPQNLDTPAKAQHGSLSSPVKVGSLTLFGRAWLGIQNPSTMLEPHNLSALRNVTNVAEGLSKVGDEKNRATDECNEKFYGGSVTSKEKQVHAPFHGGCVTSREKQVHAPFDGGSESIKEKQVQAPNSDSGEGTCSSGTSRSLDFSLRKLYRSMNVPVPQPLPSLADLMHAAKRAKVCAGKR
ncbi:5' exonuclease Apollo [Nymphaea thermarum]|nr:5' exonuclease Apollo [Nymphaea thermarum]